MKADVLMAMLAGLGASMKPNMEPRTKNVGEPYPKKKPVQMVNRPQLTKLTNHERVFYGRLARTEGIVVSEKDIIKKRNK